MFKKIRHRQEIAEGYRCADQKDWKAAAEHFLKAASLRPSDWDGWFGLGVSRKWLCQWKECLAASEKAAQLHPELDGSWWNLGIAATALGQWRSARSAWRRFGIKCEDSDKELNLNLGTFPIRLLPTGEVVWCQRIDPARAIVRNIPLPESGHRRDDLLLHDGEPSGYRMTGGKKVPVFNQLCLLKASRLSTYMAIVENASSMDIEDLLKLCPEGLHIEDWSTIRILCKKCSEGVPHEHGDESDDAPEPTNDDRKLRRLAIAAETRDLVDRLLDDWLRSHPCNLTSIECALAAADRE